MELNINCDLGEKSEVFDGINDYELLKIINTANIACGYHAGSKEIIQETIINAKIFIAISLIYSINKKPKVTPIIAPGTPKIIPFLAISISPCPSFLWANWLPRATDHTRIKEPKIAVLISQSMI